MSTTYKTIQLADAQRIIEAAQKKAAEWKKPICVAVVDAGGHLLALERTDACWIGAIELAVRKAWTARAFNAETRELAKRAAADGEFAGLSSDPRVCLMAGGVPVLQDGVVVGAVGVCGAQATDQEIAEAGVRAF